MPRDLGDPPDSPDSASSSNLYSASEGIGGQDSASISSDSRIELVEDNLAFSSEDDVEQTVPVILSSEKREPTSGNVPAESRIPRDTRLSEDGYHSLNNGHPQTRLLTDSRSGSAQPLTDRDSKRKRSLSESSFVPQSPEAVQAEDGDISEVSSPMVSRYKRTKVEDNLSLSASQGEQVATFNGPGSLPLDKSKLPAEIWHYIFTCVPPLSLGRLLQVNQSFKSYLVSGAEQSTSPASGFKGFLKPQLTEAIWSAARKLFHPTMPKPLRSRTELENWSLILGTTCQFCKVGPATESCGEQPWEAGPGKDGVRVVWPFGVRCCGSCLSKYAEKVCLQASLKS